jgi:hypothetical protein
MYMTNASGAGKLGACDRPQSEKSPMSSGASSPFSSSALESPSDQAASPASAIALDPQAAGQSSSAEPLVTPQMVSAALLALQPHLNKDGQLDCWSLREAIQVAICAAIQVHLGAEAQASKGRD